MKAAIFSLSMATFNVDEVFLRVFGYLNPIFSTFFIDTYFIEFVSFFIINL